ncbi:PE-PPE domain-containing protein [Mycolicibacter engbaekii]|uniref:PE-PPE domain-containing protein n=1 Tax=Mycolicibacter engbaekii TaxID=188915 RepID=UPI001F27DA92|nr:PE-PPE domain-containing protein [Mycolicibacter engbaekii]
MAGVAAMTAPRGGRSRRRGRAVVAVVSVLVFFAGVAGLAAPAPRSAAAVSADVALTGGDIAFVMGGSGIPLPSSGYVNAANLLYLQPHGFTGTAQSLFTPQLSFPGNLSMVQGAQILADAIEKQIAGGAVNSENPVYVFGYSQSSAMSSMTMDQLRHNGVSPEDVHFVLVGNSANPNGGLLQLLNFWGGDLTFWNGMTLGHPTPDYFTTDVYTMEYDGYADFPRYPLNLLADLNAILGMFTVHIAYFGVDADDIANAIPLETTGDGLTNYYIIPSETLPLTDLLRVNPVWGVPLAELLEPSLRILVNLGYGSLTEGWNQGPANELTSFSLELLPSHISPDELNAALSQAWSEGVEASIRALQNPANYVYGSFLEQEPFTTLWNAAERVLFDIQDPGPMFGGLFGGSAVATDPGDPSEFAAAVGSALEGNPGMSWLSDLLGLDLLGSI